MKIAIVGGGYVGIVTGACFANLGHTVAIINRDRKKSELINAAIPPIFEAGLEELLKKHVGIRLTGHSDYDNIKNSDLTFICVGTPPLEDGTADLSMVTAAAVAIGKALRTNNDKKHVVVVKSTVPPGTTEKIVIPTVIEYSERSNIGFAMNPEFLREGKAIEDFTHPDRIVIGCRDNESCKLVSSAYRGIQAPIYCTTITVAEMIKYASNSLLATKISYANEIGNICKKLGIDVYKVMKGVGMDSRISPHFLDAGAGFGGSCFPKDVNALIHLAEELGENPILLKSVMKVNEGQPGKLLSLLEKKIGTVKGKKITVLGLAFKENTDDIRDSRSIPVIDELLKKGAIVAAYDPKANKAMKELFPQISYYDTAEEALRDANACLVMTEWPEFASLDKEFNVMKSRVIIEGRRILSCQEKEGICW